MEARRRIAMATLNIKNFPEPLYEQLQKQAEDEHRSVAQQVIHLVSKSVGRPRSRSILELRGLGKEIWSGTDSAEYLREERDSWDS
jgi:hypothetical protein